MGCFGRGSAFVNLRAASIWMASSTGSHPPSNSYFWPAKSCSGITVVARPYTSSAGEQNEVWSRCLHIIILITAREIQDIFAALVVVVVIVSTIFKLA